MGRRKPNREGIRTPAHETGDDVHLASSLELIVSQIWALPTQTIGKIGMKWVRWEKKEKTGMSYNRDMAKITSHDTTRSPRKSRERSDNKRSNILWPKSMKSSWESQLASWNSPTSPQSRATMKKTK